MVRFIVFITKVVIATTISILFSSCQMDFVGIAGNGEITTETRDAGPEFTSVEVERGLEVEIEQSDRKSITVIADSNLQKHILTEISNGVLKITSDENIRSSESQKIIVTMPVIEALQSSSAAEIRSKSTIKSDDLSLSASSGSEMEIAVEGEVLSVEASSGSNVQVMGKILTLRTEASSGSEIDAEKVLSNDITAKASGSNISVYPLVSLKAKASSGANISYHNKPKTVTKESSSGGSISN